MLYGLFSDPAVALDRHGSPVAKGLFAIGSEHGFLQGEGVYYANPLILTIQLFGQRRHTANPEAQTSVAQQK
jgi:hypothetical protein